MDPPADNRFPPFSGRPDHAPPTTYEISAIVSSRAAMLANSTASCVFPGVTAKRSPLEVALHEVRQGVSPMIINRLTGIDQGAYKVGTGGRSVILHSQKQA